jgi:hypothetical protein
MPCLRTRPEKRDVDATGKFRPSQVMRRAHHSGAISLGPGLAAQDGGVDRIVHAPAVASDRR